MFGKITFEKKLGIDSDDKKYCGLKVGTVSLLVSFAGFLCVVWGAVTFGRILVVLSFFGVCIGMGIHFYAMAKKH